MAKYYWYVYWQVKPELILTPVQERNRPAYCVIFKGHTAESARDAFRSDMAKSGLADIYKITRIIQLGG
jgi:hypothetical protein